NCDDANPCTNDSCDVIEGCINNPNALPCDDGSVCTTGDSCGLGGVCSGTPVNCNDSNPCTDDACAPLTGCSHVNNTISCNDGNICTTGDHCVGGTCQPGFQNTDPC